MINVVGMHRLVLVLILAALPLGTVVGARSLSEKELREFLGSVPPNKIAWTKTVGHDFDAYSGRALPSLAGTVNIYIGGWPHFKSSPSSTKIAGHLGMFPVSWHRKMAPDGTISQEAAVKLYDLWKVDIWLEAKRQSDIDGMIAVISRLPTFTEKPKSISPQ